jgi:hypothetical protein
MRQQARDSARQTPRGSDRSATNHNPLQARETTTNQRAHDRMGRPSHGEGVLPIFIDRGDGTGRCRSARSQCAVLPPFTRRVNATAMAENTSTAAITAKVSLKPITSAWCFTALPSATMA